MLSRTHAAVGATTALAVACVTYVDPVMSVIAGGLGGLAPDVDSKRSKGSQFAIRFTVAVVIGVAAMIVRGKQTGIGIELSKNVIALIALAALLMWGHNQKHRGPTHSLVCMVLFSLPVFVLQPTWGIAWAVGYVSHLAIDLLNTKGEQLLFPSSKRFCFNVCKAGGIVDNALGTCACLVLVVVFAVKFV